MEEVNFWSDRFSWPDVASFLRLMGVERPQGLQLDEAVNAANKLAKAHPEKFMAWWAARRLCGER